MKKVVTALMFAALAAGCATDGRHARHTPNGAKVFRQTQEARRDADKKCGVVGSHQIEGTRGTAKGDYDCGVRQ